MKQLEQEMQEVIKKNLPAHVGDALKERLEQAEKDAIKVTQLEEALQSKNVTIIGLEKQVADYQKFDERNATLETREKAVSEDERNLKITILEFQLNAEKEKTQFSKDVALGLVRNTEFRKHVFDSENQNGYTGANGQWVQPTPVNKSLDESKNAM